MFYKVSDKSLPYITIPFEGELFSSWFTRSALKFDYSPLHFSKVIFNTQNIWNRDIDKSISIKYLEHFAKVNCVSLDRAKETTFTSFNNILFEDLIINSSSRFILAAGIYHRLRRRQYLQFCPSCLKLKGFYKQIWRVALFTVCPDCRILLHNCCPSCSKPILFYRIHIENDFTDSSLKIVNCFFCGFNLQDSEKIFVDEKVVQLTSVLYKKIIRAQRAKSIINFELNYFYGIHCILYALRPSNKNRHVILTTLCKDSKFPYTNSSLEKNLLFEFCDLKLRYNLIYALSVLLNNWPYDFINISNEFNLRYSDFRNYAGSEVPYWLYHVLKSKK